jgi:hypothetical protein
VVVKVVVFGSRTWTDRHMIDRRLGQLPRASTVVHGASPGGGADEIANFYAHVWGHSVIRVPISYVDYRKTKRQAPILRTIRMFDEHPDVELAIGFMVGETPGSAFTRDEARRRGIQVEIHHA